MIFEAEEGVAIEAWPHVVNVGRPSHTQSEHFKVWQEFYNYVEECSYAIKVNSAYYDWRDMAFAERPALGGGFAFNFWFETEDQKLIFTKAVTEIFA